VSVLTHEEIAAIEHEAARLPVRRSACIEALKIVQAKRRWIADDVLAAVAALLGMSTAELDGIASFYNLLYRRPVGRHVILVCDSISCHIASCEGVQRELERLTGCGAGSTSADGRFTLLPIACLGVCERAPALMIDDDVHAPAPPRSLEQTLERYR
jgi:NADH-quinone oxidoreductase subunit E